MAKYTSGHVIQHIDGVPFPMIYEIQFPDGFDPEETSAAGAVTASPFGSTVTGVFNYSAQGEARVFSMGLTCTVSGHPGPQANSCTIFVGNFSEIVGKFAGVSGQLSGIPPFQASPQGVHGFASGHFVIAFV
ncbi:hypothetical protein [Burkholderia sp. Ac-20379]|uniref:hypothetical protein n=1 Tax=Burkholderia sp. Ac-20379 TaxID=2703900 RepID=UPI00197F3BA1|nr:hypothetical protein [Burkholderia sp. Ac-20379]MBN3723572.1 hypothetical protein [Burkholderia sp. Ac-20379]